MSLVKYGYPFTSAYEYGARSRARSLDRCERSCRSSSPFGSYRTVRSSSVIPRALQYRDDREYSPETKPSVTRREYYRATSCLPYMSNYETIDSPYYSSYNYYYKTPSSYYSSIRPYDSNNYISPYLSRTYSGYSPSDSYYYYLQNSPRFYSYKGREPRNYYPYSYVPSLLRYPSLVNRTYYTRYY